MGKPLHSHIYVLLHGQRKSAQRKSLVDFRAAKVAGAHFPPINLLRSCEINGRHRLVFKPPLFVGVERLAQLLEYLIEVACRPSLFHETLDLLVLATKLLFVLSPLSFDLPIELLLFGAKQRVGRLKVIRAFSMELELVWQLACYRDGIVGVDPEADGRRLCHGVAHPQCS